MLKICCTWGKKEKRREEKKEKEELEEKHEWKKDIKRERRGDKRKRLKVVHRLERTFRRGFGFGLENLYSSLLFSEQTKRIKRD